MIHLFVDREIIPPIRHDSSFLRYTIHPSTYNSSVPLGLAMWCPRMTDESSLVHSPDTAVS